MVLGNNIGITIYPNIAAWDATVSARRAALFHTIFNVLRSSRSHILQPFTALNIGIISLTGLNAPLSDIIAIALAHTLFNFFATCLLIGFRKHFAKLLVLW